MMIDMIDMIRVIFRVLFSTSHRLAVHFISHVLDRFNQTSGEQWPVLLLRTLPSACTPSTAPSPSVMGCVCDKMRRRESSRTSRSVPSAVRGIVSIRNIWVVSAS